MSTSELFRAFDERIKAPKPQWEAAIQRLMNCAAALSEHYYSDSSIGDHLTVIGSAVKGTAIDPMADADGVFHMPSGTHHKFDSYSGNGQSALLQDVRAVLSARYPRTRIRGDGPVVVVEFTSGPSVEVVPGVLFSAGSDMLHADCLVPVTREGGSWEAADYGTELDQLQALDAKGGGQYTRLIRYMKVWRRAWGATFKSLVLELMAAEFMTKWDANRTGRVFDDWLVRDFLEHTIANYYSTYTLPTGKTVDTGVGWIEQAKLSHAHAVTACDLGDSSSNYVVYWKKVFGSDFGA